MISIGAVIGGPECNFFKVVLGRLMKFCVDNRNDGSHSAEVNVVFHVPGSIVKPDYQGLRTGRYSSRDKTLMIQVSVEEDWVALRDESKVLQYIYEVVDEALGLAKGEFKSKGIDYGLDEDRAFLDRWKTVEST